MVHQRVIYVGFHEECIRIPESIGDNQQDPEEHYIECNFP